MVITHNTLQRNRNSQQTAFHIWTVKGMRNNQTESSQRVFLNTYSTIIEKQQTGAKENNCMVFPDNGLKRSETSWEQIRQHSGRWWFNEASWFHNILDFSSILPHDVLLVQLIEDPGASSVAQLDI